MSEARKKAMRCAIEATKQIARNISNGPTGCKASVDGPAVLVAYVVDLDTTWDANIIFDVAFELAMTIGSSRVRVGYPIAQSPVVGEFAL